MAVIAAIVLALWLLSDIVLVVFMAVLIADHAARCSGLGCRPAPASRNGQCSRW